MNSKPNRIISSDEKAYPRFWTNYCNFFSMYCGTSRITWAVANSFDSFFIGRLQVLKYNASLIRVVTTNKTNIFEGYDTRAYILCDFLQTPTLSHKTGVSESQS